MTHVRFNMNILDGCMRLGIPPLVCKPTRFGALGFLFADKDKIVIKSKWQELTILLLQSLGTSNMPQFFGGSKIFMMIKVHDASTRNMMIVGMNEKERGNDTDSSLHTGFVEIRSFFAIEWMDGWMDGYHWVD